jgi:hypothetical protein
MNLTIRVFALAITALLFASDADGQVTIARRSSPVLYVDLYTNWLPLNAGYAAYTITNDTDTEISPVFVTISNFTGPQISAATNENGVIELSGGLAPFETKFVYFYLEAAAETDVTESHLVTVFGAEPPEVPLASEWFDLTAARALGGNSAVHSTYLTFSDGEISVGGELTLVVTGTVYTRWDSPMAFTPAALGSWPASDLRLTSVSISLGCLEGTYGDLLFYPCWYADTTFEATYHFSVVSMPSGTYGPYVPVVPFVTYRPSGIVKHTDMQPWNYFTVPEP